MLVPINQEQEFAERAATFARMTDAQLLEAFRNVHTSGGFVGSKMRYLAQLYDVIISRGLKGPEEFVSYKG